MCKNPLAKLERLMSKSLDPAVTQRNQRQATRPVAEPKHGRGSVTDAAVRVLAGDIGGTNARLAVVEVNGGSARIERQEQFASRDAPNLASIAQRFIAEYGEKSISRARRRYSISPLRCA